jgi:hypothetical protein
MDHSQVTAEGSADAVRAAPAFKVPGGCPRAS